MFDFTIAMFDELKLPSMKKKQKVVVAAEVACFLGEYARNLAKLELHEAHVPRANNTIKCTCS